MARPCKCRYCSADLRTDTAYLSIDKKIKMYFCNEEHYEKFVQKTETENKQKTQARQKHDRVCELFAEILGVTKITNTALYKEKAELNEAYSDDVIISYLEENKHWMMTSVGKLSGGVYGKIRYVSVILRNKLGDYATRTVSTKTEAPKIFVDNTFYEPIQTRNNKRRSLADLEDEF